MLQGSRPFFRPFPWGPCSLQKHMKKHKNSKRKDTTKQKGMRLRHLLKRNPQMQPPPTCRLGVKCEPGERRPDGCRALRAYSASLGVVNCSRHGAAGMWGN